jgi:hypothetical protein
MLIMKWKTDNEGRLVAAWEETCGNRMTIPCACFTGTPQKNNPRSPARRVGFFNRPRVRAGKAAWVFIASLLLLCRPAGAQTTGNLRGTVKDGTGAVMPGVRVSVKSTSASASRVTDTDSSGNYTFTALSVGEYDLTVAAPGFRPYRQTNLLIDINSALVVDVTLQIGEQTQSITVAEGADKAHVKTSDTQLGEVIGGQKATEVPLNGRSYTDLLAIQGGVTPITTSSASNSTSGGGFGTVPVAGNDNTGQVSINGQRESANGFSLNGASVQETIGQQAGIIPNLDSIAQFRILTSNADAEYGNYSGGLIDVVTKSGGNQFHGSVFEFLRNSALDSKGFFRPSGPHSSRTSTAERWAAPSGRTSSFSSGTTRASGQLKAWKRVLSACRRWLTGPATSRIRSTH